MSDTKLSSDSNLVGRSGTREPSQDFNPGSPLGLGLSLWGVGGRPRRFPVLHGCPKTVARLVVAGVGGGSRIFFGVIFGCFRVAPLRHATRAPPLRHGAPHE